MKELRGATHRRKKTNIDERKCKKKKRVNTRQERIMEEMKARKSRSEGKVVRFSSNSLFLARKREAITRVETYVQ